MNPQEIKRISAMALDSSYPTLTLSMYDRHLLRAFRMTYRELSQLVKDSDARVQKELNIYITDKDHTSIMVYRALLRMYKAFYVYYHVEQAGLTDEHLQWLAYSVIISLLMDYPDTFNVKELPANSHVVGNEVKARCKAFDDVKTYGLEVVMGNYKNYALRALERVQSKALSRL